MGFNSAFKGLNVSVFCKHWKYMVFKMNIFLNNNRIMTFKVLLNIISNFFSWDQ